MLSVTQLNSYLEECKTEISSIGTCRLLADDDEFSKFSKELSKAKDGIVLIGVLPTVTGSGPNEDSVKAANNLLFFCVQKEDTRQSYADYLKGYQDCQDTVIALFDKFLADYLNFDKVCTAKQFDFNNWNIEPVRNYHQTNGWALEIAAKTTM